MEPKPGYLTTEFYVSILTSVGAVIASIAGGLPDSMAAKVAMVSAAAYALSRAVAKVGPALIAILGAVTAFKGDVTATPVTPAARVL